MNIVYVENAPAVPTEIAALLAGKSVEEQAASLSLDRFKKHQTIYISWDDWENLRDSELTEIESVEIGSCTLLVQDGIIAGVEPKEGVRVFFGTNPEYRFLEEYSYSDRPVGKEIYRNYEGYLLRYTGKLIYHVENMVKIPESMARRLAGKSVEEQLECFSLERCHGVTHFIDYRTIHNPETYRGERIENLMQYPILVQDGIVVGIELYDKKWGAAERVYCFYSRWSNLSPCSSMRSYNGQRTSGDPWYYDEEHEWYVFRYIEETSEN